MRRTLLVLAAALWMATPAMAQTSRCADCHLASNSDTRLSTSARAHVDAWNQSVHARRSVGCEKCHGGDATTFDPLRAHVGVRASDFPASPVNRANLPVTCGKCHTGPFVAFQRSRHYQVLRAADERGPTCSTCHSEVAGLLFSPTSVMRRCNDCHAEGELIPRPDHGPDASLLLKEIGAIRQGLHEAQRAIERIRDRSERDALGELLRQAEVPWLEARDAAHMFVFDASRERLEVARDRTQRLLLRLATKEAAERP